MMRGRKRTQIYNRENQFRFKSKLKSGERVQLANAILCWHHRYHMEWWLLKLFKLQKNQTQEEITLHKYVFQLQL